ncbi:uncharacterized protein LOC127799854 [Diospyros lotus]|uniref:uncharacterized protein LOC127799854 n=1 Tax=Diospyros lotus TaxID=55363 RepID=UPI002259B5C9|nr:uncharacterized protein LOC127799854 [Diospyros lotus]
MSNINRMFFRMIHEEVQDNEKEEAIVTALVEHHIQSGDHDSVSRHRGSVMNRRVINRNRVEGHERLYRDYFGDSPTYPPHLFRKRFRMRQSLFLRIQVAIESHDSYFVQRYNAAGVPGLSSLQKIIAALRMLAYGSPTDVVDEYVRIGESTAIESLKRFVKAVVEVFGEQYLRRPNSIDIARLMTVAEQRGFPGMLGSIDCMHWKWANCPTAWHGMYTGHARKPTIILEAIASYDLWIWHAFFGLPGSLNDINVLDRSHVFSELAEGRGPEVKYTINGHEYTMGYYLADVEDERDTVYEGVDSEYDTVAGTPTIELSHNRKMKLWTSYRFTIKFKTAKLICNSKMISWSICGNCMVNNRIEIN